jgi:hypothetical protein
VNTVVTLFSNQFHDVIPGSSINEVYKDSAEHYQYVLRTGTALLDQAIASLATESQVTNVLGMLIVVGPRNGFQLSQLATKRNRSITLCFWKSLRGCNCPFNGVCSC